MSSYKDRVMETSTTTGTGSFTTAGAVTGYQTFNTAYSTNVLFDYCAVGVDANGTPSGEWESGIGYLSDATTLVRLTPQAGSAATPVSFSSGTKRVFSSLAAAQATGRGRNYAYRINLAQP